MFIPVLQSSIVLLLATAAFGAQAPLAAKTKPDRLLVREVDFRLVGANIRYEGVAADSSDVCLHDDPLIYRGRNYYWSDAIKDGLFAEGKSKSRIYQPYDLAVRMGWFKRTEDDDGCNNLWGMFESGGRLWMGSDGLGILEFDPRHDVWSRYDWQRQAQPGARTYLSFVDDKYMFFVSRGALFVYSKKNQVAAQLAYPLDPRLDASQSWRLQFINPEAKQNYYTALAKEFGRLRVDRQGSVGN